MSDSMLDIENNRYQAGVDLEAHIADKDKFEDMVYYEKALAILQANYDNALNLCLEARAKENEEDSIIELVNNTDTTLFSKLFKEGDIIRYKAKSRQHEETLDANKLAFILLNKDKLPTRSLKENDDWKALDKLYHALDISNGIGKLAVKYRFSNLTARRLQAVDSLSGQGMLREARHVLYETYIDVDMVNAHPMFTIWLCGHFDIKCEYLNMYTSMREPILKDIMDANNKSRGDAKQLMLAILYGSKTDNWKRDGKPIVYTTFLRSFKSEVANIHTNIVSHFQPFMDKVVERRTTGKEIKDYNHEGATMSLINQHIEAYLLNIVMSFMDEDTIKQSVLCFDGCMIPKSASVNTIIQQTNDKFKELGIDVEVKAKQFDEGFELKAIGFDKRVNYVKQYPQEKTIIESIVVDSISTQVNHFDLSDDYYWSDFCSQYTNDFDCKQDLATYVFTNLPRVMAFVGKTVIIKLSEEIPYDECTLQSLNLNTEISHIYGDKNPVSLGKFINNNKKAFKRYTHTTCVADPMYTNQKVFYTTYPYKAKLLDREVEEHEVKLFVEYIRNLICDNHEESTYQVMKWLNWLVRRTGMKSGKCLVLYGVPGCGKSSLGTYLSEYLLGIHNSCANINGLGALLKENNSSLEHKRLICVNETSTDSKHYVSSADQFKSMISERNCTYKTLYKDVRNGINDWEFILTSNHATCVRIEQGDRRFITVKTSDKYVADNEYWKTFHETLEKPEYVDKVFTYVYKLHSDNTLMTDVPVQTEIRDEIKNMTLSSSEMFIQEYTEDECNKGHKYKFSDMYSKYTQWCQANGETPKSGRALGMALKASGLFQCWKSHGVMVYQLI